MASITTAQAASFSVGAVPGRYYLDQRPTDQFFDALPFIPIEGHELVLNVIDAAEGGAGSGLSEFADAELAGAAIDQNMPAITTRTFALKRISAEMPVDSVIPSKYGSHRDILAGLINLKVEAVRDHCKHLLARGDSSVNAEEFDGLAKLASTYSQQTGASTDAANGGTVLKGEIELLLTMLNPRPTNESCYLVMHAKAFKHLNKNNYADVEYITHATLGQLPAIAGVPILIDNFLPADETRGTSNDCTSIYAVMIGEDVGLCGIFPAAVQGQEIQVRGPVVKEGTDLMWYHVSWVVALACFNKGAIARLYGVKHVN
jgi:hypothetical protein